MADDLAKITSSDELLARLADMRDQRDALATATREQCVRAVIELHAMRKDVAAAAGISRVTLNAWIDN